MTINRRDFIKQVGLGAAALAAGMGVSQAEAAPAKKPNFVIFLIDDLGWTHVGYNGGPYKTPNIDALAAGGVKLNQFYVMPVCSPTRAALLTGRYPMRYGLQVSVVRPWAQYGLPLEERTLAQSLKEAGYRTACFGKWHLGHCKPDYLPTRRGFDRQYGHYNGALDYDTHIRDGGFDWHRDDKVCRDEGYSTDLLGRESVRFIEQEVGQDPFFLYVPFNTVHSPRMAPPEWMNRVEGNPPDRTLAAMLLSLDDAIGRVVAALDRRGLRENTLILFISDNGGEIPGSNAPLRAGKFTLYEGGVRTAAFANWPGRLKAGAATSEAMHMVDLYPTLLKLAGASPEQKLPLDGVDVWPVIAEGKPTPHHEILLNATPTEGGLWEDGWKLVVNGTPVEAQAAPPQATQPPMGGKKKKGKKKAQQRIAKGLELYNLKADPYEKTNLAAEQPERVKAMLARYETYFKAAAPPKFEEAPVDYKAPAIWGEQGA